MLSPPWVSLDQLRPRCLQLTLEHEAPDITAIQRLTPAAPTVAGACALPLFNFPTLAPAGPSTPAQCRVLQGKGNGGAC